MIILLPLKYPTPDFKLSLQTAGRGFIFISSNSQQERLCIRTAVDNICFGECSSSILLFPYLISKLGMGAERNS